MKHRKMPWLAGHKKPDGTIYKNGEVALAAAQWFVDLHTMSDSLVEVNEAETEEMNSLATEEEMIEFFSMCQITAKMFSNLGTRCQRNAIMRGLYTGGHAAGQANDIADILGMLLGGRAPLNPKDEVFGPSDDLRKLLGDGDSTRL